MSGGFQYKNSELQFFPHAEGYVNTALVEVTCMTCRPASVSYTRSYDYVFNYTDHLGNIRLSYGIDPSTGNIKIIEENHYYPFGLKHTNYNSDVLLYSKSSSGTGKLKPTPVAVEPSYKYKYNGKELQDELGLNTYAYGWREYDPAIGRFNRIDRFAEKYHSLTPYGYAGNNPILFNDIQGDSIGAGKDLFNKFRNGVQDRKNGIIANRQSRIDKAIAKGKTDKASRLQAKFASQDAQIGSEMSVLNSTLQELSALESSSQIYSLYENSNSVSSSADGVTTYDVNSDEVNVSSKGKFSMGVFAHELKHAYQFQTGDLSFFADGNGGQLYDKNDEYEAFARGSFFGGLNLTRSQIDNHYSDRPQGPLNLKSPATAAKGVSSFGHQFKMETYRNSSRGTAQKQFYINWKNDTK